MKKLLLKGKLFFLIAAGSFLHTIVLGQSVSKLALSNTVTICRGNSTTLTTTLSNCTGPYTYSWSPGGQTTSSISVSPTVTTSYIVSVTGTNNCSAGIDTFVVKVNPSPIVDLGNDTTSCGCILVSAGNPGSTYVWNTGADYAIINICVSGQYWVTVSNGMCLATDTINVTINPPPLVNLGSDATVLSSIILDAGNAGSSFSWNTGAITQMITVTTSGQYSVTVTNTAGCMASDVIDITVKYLTAIPEGFSPNGDGINDEFEIKGIEDYPKNAFEIFNRWGDKVFGAQPYENTWDGRSTMGLRVGGNELPIGTYFYVLDLGDGSPIVKGTIYLNR